MRKNFLDMSMSEGLGSLRIITRHYDAVLAEKLESVAHGGNWNFAYRWMLMDFKREFPFDQIPTLWERIWAQFATSHFHVFVGLGMLLVHQAKLMAITDELDLQLYLKEMTMTTDLQAVLCEAIAALERLLNINCFYPPPLNIALEDAVERKSAALRKHSCVCTVSHDMNIRWQRVVALDSDGSFSILQW